MRLRTSAIVSLFAFALLDASVVQAKAIAFIGCPVLRDMQTPSLPCWLARDGEKLYYLGLQSDTIPPVPFYPPQLLHKVLVEAEAVEGPEVCGGLPTKAARASVLPELAPECDEVLPQGEVAAPPPVKPSAPLRKGMRLAILAPGETARPYGFPVPPPPVPPFKPKTFTLDFLFGEDFIYLDDGFVIAQAVRYLDAMKGSRITIEVPRDKVKLSNGQTIMEDEAVVARRADRLRRILVEWGVAQNKIVVVRPTRAKLQSRSLSLTALP